MAYIYKKTVDGKPYYYLRISKRENGKQIVKDVAYLGTDPAEAGKKLQELQHHEDVRKGYKNISKFLKTHHYLKKVRAKKLKHDAYLHIDIHEQIEAAKLHYNEHLLSLDEKTKKEVYEHFLIDFAFNTTSLEGNTITLEEAQKLLQDDILPKNKTLREVDDLQNTQKVFFDILNKKPKITEGLISSVHDELLDRIDLRKGYRVHDIRVFKSSFDASPVQYIRHDVQFLLKWYKEHEKQLHPLVLAAIFHHKLEKIHPFADGNGRTGRMLMNAILLHAKYPPFIIPERKRSIYLAALRKADKTALNEASQEAYNDLILFVAEEFLSSYWNNFNV